MNSIRPVSFAGLLMLGSATAFAQSSPNVAAASKAADSDWTTLQSVIKDARTPPKGANAASIISQQAAALVAAADQCKGFYAKYPASGSAKDSKCLEALMLEQAWMAGDISQQTRREQLVTQVRNDKAVTPALRAELIALADSANIAKTPNLTRDDTLAAYEQSARTLIDEFPDLLVGYQALVAVARDSADTKAATLAKEIVGMPNAPEVVKMVAQDIVDRTALVGQSLGILAQSAPVGLASLSVANRQPTIVYTWTANDYTAFGRAKTAALKAPKGTTIIGVCLDSDVVAAKAAAAANALPGTQVYDVLGRKGATAQTLKLTYSGMIYLADSTGAIRTVSAHNSLDSNSLFLGL